MGDRSGPLPSLASGYPPHSHTPIRFGGCKSAREKYKVKITDIRTAEIKGHGYSTYVRVITDEGLVGNGECIHGGEGCPRLVHGLKRFLIGEDPLEVDALFEKMRRGRLFDGAMAGAMVTAMSGIE